MARGFGHEVVELQLAPRKKSDRGSSASGKLGESAVVPGGERRRRKHRLGSSKLVQ